MVGFRRFGGFLLAGLLLSLAGPARAQQDSELPTVFVIDSSGSMAAAMEGSTRLDLARGVLAELFARWRPQAPLGLIAYGHRRTGDCGDIEVLAPVGTADPAGLVRRLDALRARGKTPLSASLQQAADLLAPFGGGKVVLLTDGLETCDADPCAVAAALRTAGVTVEVVGFALEPAEAEQLACIADAGGGRSFTAADAGELAESLEAASGGAVEGAVEADPAPPPEPEAMEPPEPEAMEPPEPEAMEPPEPAGPVPVSFRAVVAGSEETLGQPVAWRLVSLDPAAPFDYRGEGRGLSLELPPGPYRVAARAANATAIESIAVEGAGEFLLPLAVGELAAQAVPWSGAPPLGIADGLRWSLRPLDGQQGVGEALPEPPPLLAAGRYALSVAWRGTALEREIAVAVGERLEVELSFRLGTLSLRPEMTGEGAAGLAAEPDWRGLSWRILDSGGRVAAVAANQVAPAFQLPAGAYRVELAVAGATLSEAVTLEEGRELAATVAVPAGRRSFLAVLAAGAPPLEDWRETRWSVAAVEALGFPAGALVVDQLHDPAPSVALLPGRWEVTLESGHARAARQFEVAPGSDGTLWLELEAARLTIVPAVAAGQAAPQNVVFEVAPLSAAGEAGEWLTLGGSFESWSEILPAGPWRVRLSDEQGRAAEGDVRLEAGAEASLSLTLR